ncbi:uncharacterized protein M437DRAFT_73776 [Aureobasidium melanogenum CBS 110374]|uniref:Uncharacterized protein n=1 Tax=Aureobasidium melanogenum (strain CBS 110374) TaxID=1043003 RepID=A0A074W4K0_AURM1|nr:uncharacterized protein M437DRAFT_73776 [Aureobasidium melanogenum CBS 110374]KEQ64857.1 hypothetical protein M437DRAFT_73776 [Aureobasidium melanogenum CBS 110374]
MTLKRKLAHYDPTKVVATNSTPFPSPAFLRIRWILRTDEISHSVFILSDPTDLTSSEEPYSPTHPVCGEALTCPPVSSIIVSVESLDDYTSAWIYWHEPHAFPDQFDEQAGPPRFDAQGRVEYCCGEHRPGPGPQLEIVAEEGHFVTVGQFVNILHPWLRSLDGQLPLDPAYDLLVRAWSSPIRIADTKGWNPKNHTRERQTQVNIARKALEKMGRAGL